MAFKQEPGYMDNVPVKISEKYKPPRKINQAISYPQRMMINRIVQDSPSYDFTLETNVLQKMSAWKSFRHTMQAEREERMERLKQEKLEKENNLKSQMLENDTKVEEENVKQDRLLYPTTTHNLEILKPILLKNSDNVIQINDSASSLDRSPFNISDFEQDNSSPFDNMELKTINDMAELAEVLQKEESKNCYQNYVPATAYYNSGTENHLENNQRLLNYYDNQHRQQTYAAANQQISTTNQYYSYMMNGLPNHHQTQQQMASASIPEYNTTKVDRNPPQVSTATNISDTSSFKSVPDIVKSLQTQLDNAHIDLRTKPTVNHNCSDQQQQFDNSCYYNLPVALQELSTKISSMGFPLPRVARVVQLIGDDQKKVVDHLLVMTELLDLGFEEEAVSKALIQCVNDRDKAIDMLIS